MPWDKDDPGYEYFAEKKWERGEGRSNQKPHTPDMTVENGTQPKQPSE